MGHKGWEAWFRYRTLNQDWKERKSLEKRRMGWEQMPVLIRVNSVVELW